MPKQLDADPFYANLEEQGEDQVRDNLAFGRYAGRKLALAETWLRRKERERSDIFASEQIEIARDAERAARRSADASEAANTRATIALILAVVSIAVAFFW